MTYEQFWEGDVWLAQDYFRANQISNQKKSEEMWLQGLYFYHGVSVALGNALRKKGAKPIKYMSEPIRIIPMTEEEKKAKAEQEKKKLVEYLNGFKKNWESRRRKHGA